MTDLHTRLVAAVHTRAAVARAATPGPWMWRLQNGRYKFALMSGNWPHEHVVLPSAEPDYLPANHDASFMEANGPDVVLRQCEADLRRLERHAPETAVYYDVQVCAYCRAEDLGDAVRVYWPCEDALDLAAALGVEVGDGE